MILENIIRFKTTKLFGTGMASIATIKKICDICYKYSESVTLVGESGVGKSDFFKQFADEHKVPIVDIRLPYFEPPDLLGLPEIIEDPSRHKDASGRIDRVSIYTRPDFFPLKEKCILFFDEWTLARSDLKHAFYQIVLDKQIHLRKFPKKTWIVGGTNPIGPNYVGMQSVNKALLDRWVILEFKPTKKEWLNWAYKNELDEEMLQVLEKDKSLIDSIDSSKDHDWFEKQPTRRSWAKFSILKQELGAATSKKDADLLMELAKGCIGSKSAARYMALRRELEMPVSGEDVVFNLTDELRKKLAQQREGKMYLLNQTCREVFDIFKQFDKKTKDNKKKEEFLRANTHLLSVFPKDLGVTLFRRVVSLNQDLYMRVLLEDKEFRKEAFASLGKTSGVK